MTRSPFGSTSTAIVFVNEDSAKWPLSIWPLSNSSDRTMLDGECGFFLLASIVRLANARVTEKVLALLTVDLLFTEDERGRLRQ